MDIEDYLARIHYTGTLRPDSATLRGLQRAHLLTVPFENLDIALGSPIRLDEASLVDKIIHRRRGGFCYELNGLFARLLEALGFHVVLLSASGANDDGTYSQEFDHLFLQVSSPKDPDMLDGEGPWLVDVGWGNGPFEPLKLLETGPQRQGERVFQIVPDGCRLVLSEREQEVGQPERWINHYSFSLRPRRREDFFEMCRFHQTSPDSPFTQKRLCTLFLPDGRLTLSGRRLITTRQGVRMERELENEAQVTEILEQRFGIQLQPGNEPL